MGGGVYGENEYGRYIQKVKADPFYDTIESIVEQADTPVLIFVPFRSTAHAIFDSLVKSHKVGLITGDTKEVDRSAYFDRVQSGTLDALIAVAGTMSHGLTLTSARYILWALPPYSFEEYDQANGRVIRDGQRNDVVIYHLIQNNLARDLFKRLETKEKLQTAVLNLIGG
jgi:SNF2 family DNA or RNA helicase